MLENVSIKGQVNLAIDQLESAGYTLAEVRGTSDLNERLSEILRDLEQWKADVWESLDAWSTPPREKEQSTTSWTH